MFDDLFGTAYFASMSGRRGALAAIVALGIIIAGAVAIASIFRSWDFDGAGDYPVRGPKFDGSETRVAFGVTYAFGEPGTYFPALRVTSQREGDVTSPFARVQNVGRVRVVVS